MVVTPLVGVWIETRAAEPGKALQQSLPSWECGLKLNCNKKPQKDCDVTPLVGVWIETKL